MNLTKNVKLLTLPQSVKYNEKFIIEEVNPLPMTLTLDSDVKAYFRLHNIFSSTKHSTYISNLPT